MHHIDNINCILGRKESHWRLPLKIRAAFTLMYATSVTDSRLKTEQNNGMKVWKTNLTVETHIGDANWEWPFFHFNMSNKRCLNCGMQFFLWQTQTQFQWEKKQQWVKRQNATLSKNLTKMSVFLALRWCDQNIWIVLLLHKILPKSTRNVLICWILFNIQNICHIRGANATTNINHPAKKKHICCQPQRTLLRNWFDEKLIREFPVFEVWN